MNKLTTSLTAIALAAGFSLAAIAPASADQAAATRNEIIGGLVLVAGVATAINVSNKNAEANDYSYGYNGGDNGYRTGRDYRGDEHRSYDQPRNDDQRRGDDRDQRR